MCLIVGNSLANNEKKCIVINIQKQWVFARSTQVSGPCPLQTSHILKIQKLVGGVTMGVDGGFDQNQDGEMRCIHGKTS